MRIACIGDVHGVRRWKEAKTLVVDYYVFVGDYVDSEQHTDEEILSNLLEIIDFKLQHKEEVILLLGNHDVQYLFYPDFRCSGYRSSMQAMLRDVFQSHLDLFQVAFHYDSHMFTHGGLTRRWVDNEMGETSSPGDLCNQLNEMLHTPAVNKLSMIGPARGGQDLYSGPFWCDYHKELLIDPLPEVNQVVGHTRGTYLVRKQVAGCELYNVNYLAYSDEPIFVLEV